MIYEYVINNLDEMKKIVDLIINLLKPNIYLILRGDLGMGKTTLTQLVAKELGIREKVTSPTFNIMNRYYLKDRDIFFNHFDFFRLKKDENLSNLKELTFNNINFIEWPEIVESFWEKEDLIIVKISKIKTGMKSEQSRKFVIKT